MKLVAAALLLLISGKLMAADENPSYLKGLQFYKESKYLLAIGSLKAALDSGYQDYKVHMLLANSYLQANEDLDKALEHYKFALELAGKPDLQGVFYYNIGQLYNAKKEYQKSIDSLNMAYQYNSQLEDVFWFKGMNYYEMKNKESTISEWEKYLTIQTNGPESENIRKALAILKATNFNFNQDLSNIINNNTANGTNSNTNKTPSVVDGLIDVEGVLDNIKPNKKGKVSDDSLEGLEN